MSGKAPYYLGLETGGTKATATVLDAGFNQLATHEASRPAGATAQDTLNQLIDLGRAVQEKAGLAESPTAIGWGFGGQVDRKQNRPAINFHESGWETVSPDPASQLQAALHAPVYIENDCNVAALAEAHLGAGSTDGLNFYMTLGSGVGGGIIWNGNILDSGPMGEGEIGHVNLVPQGATCACGKCGCVEAYCSGWGIGERAVESIRSCERVTPLMQTILDAEPRQRTKLLFADWPDNAFAREQAEQFLNHLTAAIVKVALLLAPGTLVLGGGLSKLPWLLEQLASRVEAELPELMRGHTQIKIARLDAVSVSCGAALYASHRVIKQA